MEKPAAAERKAEGQRLGGEPLAGRLGVPGNIKQDEMHKSRGFAVEARFWRTQSSDTLNPSGLLTKNAT